MPLPRTKTLGMQDVTLSATIDSITTAQTIWLVSPISGYVERVLAVRGGAHDSTEVITLTIGANAAQTVTMVTGGAALDVDAFELSGQPEIAAGESIKLVSTGSPVETTKVGLLVVIKRL